MEKDIISVVKKEESSLSKLQRVPFAPNVIVCGGVREAKVITAKASMWNVVSSAGHCLGNGRAHCVVLEFRWGFFVLVAWYVLGFPRDHPRRDVPLSLCSGTKRFSCPGVPSSWDKGKSKCPGTKSLFQKNTKNRKRTFQNRKMTRFFVLGHNLLF